MVTKALTWARAWLRGHQDLVVVLVVVVGVGAGNLELTSAQTNHQIAIYKAGQQRDQAERARQQRAEQAAQQRQGQQIEAKLCGIFGGVAALKPPAGNPVTNPSRGYDQQLHQKLSEVGPALRCPASDKPATAGN